MVESQHFFFAAGERGDGAHQQAGHFGAEGALEWIVFAADWTGWRCWAFAVGGDGFFGLDIGETQAAKIGAKLMEIAEAHAELVGNFGFGRFATETSPAI